MTPTKKLYHRTRLIWLCSAVVLTQTSGATKEHATGEVIIDPATTNIAFSNFPVSNHVWSTTAVGVGSAVLSPVCAAVGTKAVVTDEAPGSVAIGAGATWREKTLSLWVPARTPQ